MALFGDFLPHPYNTYPTTRAINGEQSARIDSSDPALSVVSFTCNPLGTAGFRMVVWQSSQPSFLATLTPPTNWHQHPDFASSSGLIVHYTQPADAADSLVEYLNVPNTNYIHAMQLVFNNIDLTAPFKGSDPTATTAASGYVTGPVPTTIKPATPFKLSTRTGVLLNLLAVWGDTGTGLNNFVKSPAIVQHHPDRRYYEVGGGRSDDNGFLTQAIVSFLHIEDTYNDDQVFSVGSPNTSALIPNVKLHSMLLFIRHGFQHSTFQGRYAYPF